jgi:hypothetical protein
VNGLSGVDWVAVGELLGMCLAGFGGAAIGVSRALQAKLAESLKPVVMGVVQEVLPPLVPPLVAKEVELNREADAAAVRAELDALAAALDEQRQRVARLEGASGALATVMGAREAGGTQAA